MDMPVKMLSMDEPSAFIVDSTPLDDFDNRFLMSFCVMPLSHLYRVEVSDCGIGTKHCICNVITVLTKQTYVSGKCLNYWCVYC